MEYQKLSSFHSPYCLRLKGIVGPMMLGIVRKQFLQVARVVVVVFVYVCEEMVQPLAHIDLCQLAMF